MLAERVSDKSLYMRLLPVWLICAIAVYGNQSLITTTQVGTITLPSAGGVVGEPYRQIGDTRLEVRLTDLSECRNPSSGYGNNFIQISGRAATGTALPFLGLGCSQAGVKSLSMYTGASQTVHATADEIGERTDVIVRVQRDTANSRFLFQVWASDGTKLAERAVRSSLAAAAMDGAITAQPLLAAAAGSGTTSIAWIRWYRGIVPLDAPMPVNRGVRGDLGNWELEGDLTGTGADGTALNISRPATGCPDGNLSSCFAPSPVHKPVIQALITNAVAGADMVLDGSYSSTYDDRDLTDFRWEWISGPEEPVIVAPTSVRTEVTDVLAGQYVFRISLKDTISGETLTRDFQVNVKNTDALGLPIFPVAAHQLTATTSIDVLDLASVAGAADARITVRKPDGGLLPAVICSSAPCIVPIDNRQRDHSYKIEFRDSAGNVIATSGWKVLRVSQATKSPVTYAGNGFNKFGTYLAYNTPEKLGDPALSAASGKFFSTRLYVGVNGRNPREWNPDMPMSLRYIDAVGIYSFQTPQVRESAEARGFYMEDIFAHFSKNHSYKVAPSIAGWVGMDRFDAMNGTMDGVYTGTDGRLTDRSLAAYNGGSIPLTSAANQLYVGYSEPFDEINVQAATAGVGCSTAWEYWNGGAWAAITPRSDTTTGFAASGKLLFTPAADWSRTTLSAPNAKKKWWLRASVTACSAYPVFSRIYGDDLATGRTNAFGNPVYRGWCASSPTRINMGLTGEARSLEYDPTPPSECSARFRWQARMLAIWASNLAVCNITDVQSGEYTCARYIVDESAKYMRSEKWNGVFLDDLYEPNTRDVVEPPANNVPSLAAAVGIAPGNYVDHLERHFERVGAYLRELDPSYKIAANTGYWQTARQGNMALIELGSVPWAGAYEANANGSRLAWDQFRPENNPTGTLGLYAIGDTLSGLEVNGDWVAWDRGSRGPMTAYAQYLMYANENTACFYTTSNAFWYGGRDDFTYWNEAPEFRTDAAINRDKAAGKVKIITGDFTRFNQQRFPAVNITSIENGTVQLTAPVVGLTAGQYVWIEGTSNPDHDGMARVTAVSGNSFRADVKGGSSTGGTVRRQPASERMRFGDKGEYLALWKVDDTRVATTDKIWNDYDAGAGMYRLRTGHLSVDPLPPVERIAYWGYWTPAFDIDPGSPDTENGIVGDDGRKGNRKLVWKTRQQTGTRNGVSARSYTKALVLWASGWYAQQKDYDTYSEDIELDGTYYPLRVDGTTGPGITSVRLRSGEGAILMREPIR